ncbi:MBL fold metallo-hydrolase [Chromohalobacter israelensis]|uniref:MBL fold metallo-hydrolase n=1 Tax=Chromohalobacter israelensis TaxID=141390 RepID=UPI003AF5B400
MLKKSIIAATFATLIPFFSAHAAVSSDSSANEATFITLGTSGGPVIKRERSEPANAVVVNNDVYLFDTGSGTERQMVGAGLPMKNLRAIFISHHHIDHDADLGQLIASRWMFNHYKPLPIIGPPGTEHMVQSLISADQAVEWAPIGNTGPKGKPTIASTVAPKDMSKTMDEPTEVYKDENIRVLAITNTHYNFPEGSKSAEHARSYSYRIETPGRTFLFTGDTGPSQNVVELAKGADVLVSEVIDLDKMTKILRKAPDLPSAMLPNMIKHMKQDHLVPTEIGKLANKAGVKEVVLTHIVPGSDGETDLSGYTKGIDKYFKGPVHVAEDLDRF